MPASALFVAAFTLTQVHTFEYDELGQVIAERSGHEGRIVATYGYDHEGRRTRVTNGNGESRVMTYDALGRLATSTDPSGGTTHFAYDAADRVTAVTDPRGLSTTYRYNGFGDLLTLVSPDSGTTTHAYRADGLLERTTRNDGTQIHYGYDGLGRVNAVNGGADQRYFAYDTCGAGFLCSSSVFDAGAQHVWTGFSYTADGRVLSRKDVVHGVEDRTSYQYDHLGQLTGIVYPSGLGVGYGYDRGRVTTITATVDGTTQTVLGNVRYAAFGGPETWTYGNGLERRYNLDAAGRLTGVSAVHDASATLAQSLTYGFDGADRIKAIVNAAGDPARQDFGYYANGNLAWDQLSDGASHWIERYDANGNRLTYHGPDGPEQYTMDPASNRLLSIGGTANAGRHHVYTYDGRGNRIGDTTNGVTTSLVYDAFNRLKHVGRAEGVQVCEPYATCRTLPAGVTTYRVNAQDQRVAKSGPNGEARYVFGSQTQLLAQHESDGWTSYIWFGNELVGMTTPSNAGIVAWYAGYPIPVGHPGVKFVHNDHLGRPEAVTSGNKVTVWRAKNYAFDRNVSVDLIGGLDVGFPGQYYDAESDLWSNGYRDYDAKVGGYAQTDPLGLVAGINTYAYVLGNPVNLVDPDGLQAYRLLLNSRSTNDSIPHIRPASEGTIVMGPLRGAAAASAVVQAGILGGMTAPVTGGSAVSVCKNERAREAAIEICMMAGACAGTDFKNPHPANLPEQGVVIDRTNKGRIRDGLLREAADAWKVTFPSR